MKSPHTLEIRDVVDNPQNQLVHDGAGHEDNEEMGFCGMNNNHEEEDTIDTIRHRNAQFILKTKETNLLTQKCVDNIIEDSTELVRGTVKTIKSGLQNCLNDAGINFNAVSGLNELFAEENPISNPFEHVSTKYKQNDYFRKEFGLVVSFYKYILEKIILCSYFLVLLILLIFAMCYENIRFLHYV